MTTTTGEGVSRPSPAPSSVVSVPLRSRRAQRGQLFQKIQHAIPAGPLLFQGLKALGDGAHGFELALAVTEVVTSAFLLITVVREFRAPSHDAHHAHGVDWSHIWAAGVLVAEIGEHWHVTHHLQRPTILTAIFTLGLGLFHERIAHRKARGRQLRIDDDGIVVMRRPRPRWQSTWKELAAVTVGEQEATLRTRAGREQRIDFTDLFNAPDVRSALLVAQQRLEEHRPRR